MKVEIFRGIGLRKALHIAQRMGCVVTYPRRTGEVVLAHPLVEGRVRANGRRKDASCAIIAFLTRVMSRGIARAQ